MRLMGLIGRMNMPRMNMPRMNIPGLMGMSHGAGMRHGREAGCKASGRYFIFSLLLSVWLWCFWAVCPVCSVCSVCSVCPAYSICSVCPACPAYPVCAAAQSYTFAVAGFGNKVDFTNVEGDAVVQVSQPIVDYLIDELMDCPSMVIYDGTPAAAQARADEVSSQLELGNLPAEYKDIQADYIISGYLSNIGVTFSLFQMLVPGGHSYNLRVDLAVKIYECSTGRCVYTAVGKGEAASEDFDVSLLGLHLLRCGDTQFSSECYDAALQKAVKQAADKIKRDI